MLNHLRFADDIVLLTHTPQEAEQMVRQINKKGKKVRLQLNAKKTKMIRNRFADLSAVRLDQTTLEDITEYAYLGRLINMGNHLKPKIFRRRRAA
ncbi:hypothetical protein ANCDUO_21340 [Ancylostoma duodenale]|uniref:Reverse transcriptase domain-containing protein n=1 Tax=Ancylostoma duodenale TaxID=51022 RepID=A0A0C2FPF3_9BILA|nr:hypothetical protein ANCDUO_21340 [Ancylostoma duodenale]